MNVVWERQGETAADVRAQLAGTQPMKDSTVRTVLRRLEAKGYVRHTTRGRTYVWWPKVASRSVAADAVRGIVDRFCDDSVEDLLVGMVDDELVTLEKLSQLAKQIAKAAAAPRGNRPLSQDAYQWLVLLFDVSVKAVLLAAMVGLGLSLLRMRDANVRYRV